MIRLVKSAAVALLASTALLAAPAMAQATRTWVSGVGDDANPCSRTAPCKTFAGAISKTAAGGEINTLDPGGFGAVTITKSITIRSDSVEGGILVSGTNGIIVNAGATDRVLLQGLDFVGLGTGLSGIRVLNARDVIVTDSTIQGFTIAGVTIDGSSKTRVTLDNVRLIGNDVGVLVSNSAGQGSVKVARSLFSANTNASIRVTGTGNTAAISDNQFYGSPKALDLQTGGTATSSGNNTFGTSTTDAPTITPQG